VRTRLISRTRPPEGTGALLAVTLLLSIGKGTFLATVLIYLLHVAGLGTLAATTAMTLWGAASAAVTIPTGMLVDRGHGRLTGVLSASGVVVLVPLLAHLRTLWALMLVLFVAGGLDSAGNVVRRALVAGGTGDSLNALAWARTVSNVGFALGGLCSVWLLSDGSAGAYRVGYALIGVGYVLMAGCFAATSLARRPRAAVPAMPDKITPAARPPRRYPRAGAALAAATAVLTIHATLLSVVLPLWVSGHTDVPVSILGWLVALNSVITIGGQIPVSRLATTTGRALRCLRGSAMWTAGCCALLPVVVLVPPVAQVALLVAATILLTAGEMFEAAGEWGLSATLAADGEHGYFQSACVLGEATQSAVGPLAVGSMVTAFPVLSWPVLIVVIGVGRHLAGHIVQPVELRAGRQAATVGAD
jgi:MFS family permease